jgi:hypothetical protein
MKALKKEMPALVQEAKRDHDLGTIPASKEYKTRGSTRNVSGSDGKLVDTIFPPHALH